VQRDLAKELETRGSCIDSLEFSGGPFNFLRPHPLAGVVELCRRYQVEVSADGLNEGALMQRAAVAKRYVGAWQDLGVDIVGLSSRITTGPAHVWRDLVELIQRAGLKVSSAISLNQPAGAVGTREVGPPLLRARQLVDAGVHLVVLESEGRFGRLSRWRNEIVAQLIDAIGLERVMLEAVARDELKWYVTHLGPEVNLMVNLREGACLESMRNGIRSYQEQRSAS
jgi:phosphosulfolactate synthase (CoM biosynthesis protein A)